VAATVGLNPPVVIDSMTSDLRPDALAYEVHTNRELDFMLNRGKPLAHFSEWYPPEPDETVIPREAFAPHVAVGRFVMREFVHLGRRPSAPKAASVLGSLHVFYALPHEAWRIDAFIMVIAAADKAGWSEGLERLEGSLLGYQEWQTDLHLQRMRSIPDTRRCFPWLKKS
jgi:hypothetical protein